MGYVAAFGKSVLPPIAVIISEETIQVCFFPFKRKITKDYVLIATCFEEPVWNRDGEEPNEDIITLLGYLCDLTGLNPVEIDAEHYEEMQFIADRIETDTESVQKQLESVQKQLEKEKKAYKQLQKQLEKKDEQLQKKDEQLQKKDEQLEKMMR